MFSNGMRKDRFTGFSGAGPGTGEGKGARIGLIFPSESRHPIYRISDEEDGKEGFKAK